MTGEAEFSEALRLFDYVRFHADVIVRHDLAPEYVHDLAPEYVHCALLRANSSRLPDPMMSRMSIMCMCSMSSLRLNSMNRCNSIKRISISSNRINISSNRINISSNRINRTFNRMIPLPGRS